MGADLLFRREKVPSRDITGKLKYPTVDLLLNSGQIFSFLEQKRAVMK